MFDNESVGKLPDMMMDTSHLSYLDDRNAVPVSITGREIKERNFKRQDKEYKQLRSYIDRIETFAKGFGLVDGEKIYDIETFKQVATPYFGLIIKPRINAFFESAGITDQAYSDIKKLLEKI